MTRPVSRCARVRPLNIFLSRSARLGIRRRKSLRWIAEALESRCLLTVPHFSSLPGADHTVYLDFDGETVTNTSWNNYYNQATLVAPAYDIDGNSSSFNATELARIEEAWKRTAEDFRPFQINVTTVDPGVEALRRSGSGDTQWGIRVIVTNEANMVTDPNERCGCGGIAYIDSFNWSSDTPVWVYTSGGKSIAEAASHEVGHSLGLSHDGLNTGTAYYSGHGSGETGWAPIMGVGYYENVTQWDRGEYYDSNNGGSGANYGDGPDDLALITGTNGFGYRADDHGDSLVGATALSVSGTSVSAAGVIETTNDLDVFSFQTGAGQVTLDFTPFTPGPNLDIRAELLDVDGNVVAVSDSSTQLSAGFSLTLAAGQYFVTVDGTGWGSPGSPSPSGYSDYASLGQYSLSGSIVDPGQLPSVSVADATATEGPNGALDFVLTLSSVSDSDVTVNYSTSDGSAVAGNDYIADSGSVTIAAGQTSATVSVSLLDDATFEPSETMSLNLIGASGATLGDDSGLGTILDDDPQPLPAISISDASVQEGKENTKGKRAGTRQETTMQFTVTLSTASSQSVTAAWTTQTTGSATDQGTGTDPDFVADSGTVTFAAGVTSQTIEVVVLGDNTTEPDETFEVVLSQPTNATLVDATGVGTILNDDGGGGGTGGGGNGGGKGNGKPKRASELSPIVIADPRWYFEGTDDHDASGHHGHHHNHHGESEESADRVSIGDSAYFSSTAVLMTDLFVLPSPVDSTEFEISATRRNLQSQATLLPVFRATWETDRSSEFDSDSSLDPWADSSVEELPMLVPQIEDEAANSANTELDSLFARPGELLDAV